MGPTRLKHTQTHCDTKGKGSFNICFSGLYPPPAPQPGAGRQTKSWQGFITKNRAWQQTAIFCISVSPTLEFLNFLYYSPPGQNAIFCCYVLFYLFQAHSVSLHTHTGTHKSTDTNSPSEAWWSFKHPAQKRRQPANRISLMQTGHE